MLYVITASLFKQLKFIFKMRRRNYVFICLFKVVGTGFEGCINYASNKCLP
jgi:hypothetical protein